MNYKKIALIAGALLGMTAVMAGAFGAHALKEHLLPDQLKAFQTAARYQMYHALLLLFLSQLGETNAPLLRTAIISVIVGVFLFSGSIYLLVLVAAPVGIITPMGGLALIIGWGALALWGWKKTF